MDITINPQSISISIDDVLLGCSLPVLPSGDTTGVRDAEAIQKSIDTLQATLAGTMSRGTVMLSGEYYINAPVRIGSPGVHGYVALVGNREATLTYVGQDTSDYMVRIFGKGTGVATVLSNLNLYGMSRTRGVLVSYAANRAVIDSVQFHSMRGVGLDLLECIGLTASNLMFHRCDGFAVRGYQANACHFTSIGVAGGSGLDESVWPTSSDTYATKFDGEAFTTKPSQRSAIFLNGSGSLCSLLMLESLQYGDYPLVHLNTDSFHFVMTRLEGNKTRKHKFVIDGGRYNVVDGVSICDGHPLNGTDYNTPNPDTACETFIRCLGSTVANKLNRLAGNAGCTSGLLLHDGGDHIGNVVTECYAMIPYIKSTDQINSVNNPQVTSGFPG